MKSLDNLAIKAFGMTKDQAHAKGVCIRCKETVPLEYQDREYRISALCEKCFDILIGGGDRVNT